MLIGRVDARFCLQINWLGMWLFWTGYYNKQTNRLFVENLTKDQIDFSVCQYSISFSISIRNTSGTIRALMEAIIIKNCIRNRF